MMMMPRGTRAKSRETQPCGAGTAAFLFNCCLQLKWCTTRICGSGTDTLRRASPWSRKVRFEIGTVYASKFVLFKHLEKKSGPVE